MSIAALGPVLLCPACNEREANEFTGYCAECNRAISTMIADNVARAEAAHDRWVSGFGVPLSEE